MQLPKIDPPIDQEEAPILHTHIFHKEYPRLKKIKFPPSKEISYLANLLKRRKSIRNFGTTSLNRVIQSINNSFTILDHEEMAEHRSYPSAGARFPIELYLISFNLEGIDKGVYHYSLLGNHLEVLLQKDIDEHYTDIVSPYVHNAPCAILLTTVLSRSEVKYGMRSYLYSALECGHIGQNLYLAATELGLGCCAVGGFKDETLKELIDLTDEELPMYVLAIGEPKNDE